MVLGWLTATALAGYGDAGAGFPTPEARQMHVWVNATRVDPAAFEPEYNAGGCSYYTDFSASEQTPKEPYRYDPGLTEAALVHNLDMISTGVLTHTSSDGTAWNVRIGRYYSYGTIAENVAWSGWPSETAQRMVQSNWMCSNSGHRGSLMSSLYDDLGAAFGGSTFDWFGTTDMGLSGQYAPPVRMGAHEPVAPTSVVDFLADWHDTAGPDLFEVVVGGVSAPLALTWGAASSGVYTETLPVPRGACHPYFFRAERAGVETRFPEDGAYSFGACAGADPDTGWLPLQVGPLGYAADPFVAGSPTSITVTGAVPGQLVQFVRGTGTGNGPCPPVLGGACLGVTGTPSLLGSAVADVTGTATLALTIPSFAPIGATVYHQAVVSDGLGNWFPTAVLAAVVQ